jgi:hypothetical protein
MRRLARTITALALAAVLAGPAAAASSLQRRIYESFMDGDYARAATLIEAHLSVEPRDAAMLYNAACAYCHLDQLETAAAYLRRAVEAGFDDLDQISADPDLAPLRNHPVYLAAVDHLKQASTSGVDCLQRWRDHFGDKDYHYDLDPQRRIAYATALDPTSHQEMRRMVEQEADHLRSLLFDAPFDSYLLIAVPTPEDGRLLFNDDARAGGIYEHEKHRLIARDTGSSLRHELVHALHYAHMDQVGQRHPMWVQEGLASLYESYVMHDDGTVVFLPNERHNIVKALALTGGLTPWRELFATTDEQFMAAANRNYPQARSVFEFLAERNMLAPWYRALVDTFDEDPTGMKAFEVCFNEPLSEVEMQWRAWAHRRPKVDIAIDNGDAALGIESDPHASNDGVLIAEVFPGSAADAGDLEAGDVIVAVDGRPTRSLTELQTIIAAKAVGDRVTVRARRNGDYFTVVIRLRPL